MSDHYTASLEEDEAQWVAAICNCGWNGGLFPSYEDAADALMDHAYAAGIADARAAVSGEPTP